MPKNFIYGGYVFWKKDEWRDIIGHNNVEDATFTTDLIKGTDHFCPTLVLEEMGLDSDEFTEKHLNKNDPKNYVYDGSKTWEEIVEIAKECCNRESAV